MWLVNQLVLELSWSMLKLNWVAPTGIQAPAFQKNLQSPSSSYKLEAAGSSTKLDGITVKKAVTWKLYQLSSLLDSFIF
jgi:hypothetical protein